MADTAATDTDQLGHRGWTRAGVLRAGAAGLAAMGAPGVACAPAGDSGGSGPPRPAALPPATVEFLFAVSGARMTDWESQIVVPFTAKHPSVKVNLNSVTGDFIPKLVALVASGSSPDAMESGGWNARPLVLRGGLLQPIDDLLKRDRIQLPKVSEKLLTQGAINAGKTYLVPYATGGSPAMMYNRAIFAQEGVPEPPAEARNAWTWEQWLDAMRRVTKKGTGTEVLRFGVDQLGQTFFLPALWGGQWLSDDLKTVLSDSKPVVDAYTAWHEAAVRLGVAPAKGGAELNERFGRVDHFMTGKVATSSGVRARLRELADAPDLDCAFMPWPRPKVSTPEVYPHGLGLMPPAARREQAWAWIAYLYEGSRFARFQNRPPLVPADATAWATELFKSKPRARPQVLAQGIEVAVPPDPFWDHPGSDDMDREHIQPALVKVMAGEATPADELRRIKAPMQAIADRR